jgi:hypothetical protein
MLSAEVLIVSMRVLECLMPRGGVPINESIHTHSVNNRSYTWDCTLTERREVHFVQFCWAVTMTFHNYKRSFLFGLCRSSELKEM